ncbi:MAG: hypothetical protein ACRC37_07120, partial [Lentisphaeria bacterium]
AWPVSIIKLLRSKNAGGKSVFFLLILIIGYIFGIINKFQNPIDGKVDLIIFFYLLNMFMVIIDMILVIRYSYGKNK